MRLIDVDRLTDGSGVFSEFIHMDLQRGSYITVKDLIDVLDSTPTAYDVDKVVKRLEEARKIMMPVVTLDDAVGIVKSELKSESE